MQKLREVIEKHKGLILDAYDYIMKHPETGYREVQTSKYLEDAFVKLGYELIKHRTYQDFIPCLIRENRGRRF